MYNSCRLKAAIDTYFYAFQVCTPEKNRRYTVHINIGFPPERECVCNYYCCNFIYINKYTENNGKNKRSQWAIIQHAYPENSMKKHKHSRRTHTFPFCCLNENKCGECCFLFFRSIEVDDVFPPLISGNLFYCFLCSVIPARTDGISKCMDATDTGTDIRLF